MRMGVHAADGLIDERSSRSKTDQQEEPAACRHQVAELTFDDISQMPPDELWRIVTSTSSDWPLLERPGDQRHLRRLVWLARRTCRRQGY